MKKTAFGICQFICATTFAGTIGFNIQYTGNTIVIQNNGSEAVFEFSSFNLANDQHWHKLNTKLGLVSYLEPKQKIDIETVAPTLNNSNDLIKLDPLLIIFNDQSGSAFTQLAWRHQPLQANYTLPYTRQGTQLIVLPPQNGEHQIVKTYAIVVPYEGIEALVEPLKPIPTPPQPLVAIWPENETNKPLEIETGRGLSGAWLIHESPTGELSLQIITDGKQRGREQIPYWLLLLRYWGLSIANALVVFGLMIMIISFMWNNRKNRLNLRQP